MPSLRDLSHKMASTSDAEHHISDWTAKFMGSYEHAPQVQKFAGTTHRTPENTYFAGLL